MAAKNAFQTLSDGAPRGSSSIRQSSSNVISCHMSLVSAPFVSLGLLTGFTRNECRSPTMPSGSIMPDCVSAEIIQRLRLGQSIRGKLAKHNWRLQF